MASAKDRVTQQYEDSSNLSSRISLHERYGTGLRWQSWVFDQLALIPGEAVLEVGCGPGNLWRENINRLQPCALILTDLSRGMIAEARMALGREAGCAVADAERLPFRNAAFDLVVANHMLYHVPDLEAALADLRRVLRPGGRLIAATNGLRHLTQISDLIRRHLRLTGDGAMVGDFSLDSGRSALRGQFGEVRVLRAPSDPLRVTGVRPLVDYIRSTGKHVDGTPTEWQALAEEVAAEIAARGYFEVTRETGLFICRP